MGWRQFAARIELRAAENDWMSPLVVPPMPDSLPPGALPPPLALAGQDAPAAGLGAAALPPALLPPALLPPPRLGVLLLAPPRPAGLPAADGSAGLATTTGIGTGFWPRCSVSTVRWAVVAARDFAS